MQRAEILDLLTALGRRLRDRDLQGDIYLVGGAAIALAYNERRVTRDIDAAFEPRLVMYEIAADIAAERGLAADWLNDSVKGLLAGPDPYAGEIIELPGLRCQVASPQRLLGLKVLAHRVEKDLADVRVLAEQLGLRTAEEVLDLAVELLHPRRLPVTAQYFVEDAMQGPHG